MSKLILSVVSVLFVIASSCGNQKIRITGKY